MSDPALLRRVWSNRQLRARLAADEANSGGSGSQPLDKFASWTRTGAPDGTSGSFDFVADQTHADPHGVITVDASADWVTNFGYAVPQASEAGLYSVSATVVQNQSTTQAGDYISAAVRPLTMDSSGAPTPDYPNPQDLGYIYIGFPFGYASQALRTVVVPLPAGAHFDIYWRMTGLIGGVALDPTRQQMTFLVHRIA